jgi:hypothetical protein
LKREIGPKLIISWEDLKKYVSRVVTARYKQADVGKIILFSGSLFHALSNPN